MTIVLELEYYPYMNEIEINTTLRVSIWAEGYEYLMPSQFKEVRNEGGRVKVIVESLDPDSFISSSFLEKKFLFGHPKKIIGHGILKKISV